MRAPEINPHAYGQIIYDKGGKKYNGEKTISYKWCQESWTVACKTTKLLIEHSLTPYTKINSK